MSYHVDRFYAAVSVLASHGHIKQRLMWAYEEELDSICDDELPVAVREAFVELQRTDAPCRAAERRRPDLCLGAQDVGRGGG